MTRLDSRLQPLRSGRRPAAPGEARVSVEIHVGAGFDAQEAASIARTLAEANHLLQERHFGWRYVSDNPGLLEARCGLMVRAEPAIDNHGLSDIMFVVGGRGAGKATWLGRVRQMQGQRRVVALLSDAATAYIRAVRDPGGKVTTHWRDTAALRETGYHPGLTERLAENAGGVITAAGAGSTAELVIALISGELEPRQIAELGNLLLLPTLRKSDAEQPRDLAGNSSMFDRRVTETVRLMEAHIAEPLNMAELTRAVGLSSRQVERVFREVFDQSPARFYKQLRTRKAWALVQETLLPLADIAVATGFGSVASLSKAVRELYGETPAQARARKDVSLLKFA